MSDTEGSADESGNDEEEEEEEEEDGDEDGEEEEEAEEEETEDKEKGGTELLFDPFDSKKTRDELIEEAIKILLQPDIIDKQQLQQSVATSTSKNVPPKWYSMVPSATNMYDQNNFNPNPMAHYNGMNPSSTNMNQPQQFGNNSNWLAERYQVQDRVMPMGAPFQQPTSYPTSSYLPTTSVNNFTGNHYNNNYNNNLYNRNPTTSSNYPSSSSLPTTTAPTSMYQPTSNMYNADYAQQRYFF